MDSNPRNVCMKYAWVYSYVMGINYQQGFYLARFIGMAHLLANYSMRQLPEVNNLCSKLHSAWRMFQYFNTKYHKTLA